MCSPWAAVNATYLPSRLTAGVSSATATCAAEVAADLIAAGQEAATVNFGPLRLVPPPPEGELGTGGLKTVTTAVSGFATSDELTVAWICVELMVPTMGRVVCVAVFQ